MRSDSDGRQHFWQSVDSGQQWRSIWLGSAPGWMEQRNEGCVALMSDGERCRRFGAEHGWCHFHWNRVNEWFASTHGEQIIRAARRDDPDAFRFVIDAAELRDAHRVLEEAGTQVYFLACGDAVKIGYSKNPAARVTSLRQGRKAANKTLAPDGLDLATAEIVGCIPGGMNVEQRIHHLLSSYRLVGEWFRITPTVIQAIDCLVFGAESPRAIESGLRDLMSWGGGGNNRRRNRMDVA